MDLLNFFFNLHQIMYSFGKQTEKIWGEGHFKEFNKTIILLHSRLLDMRLVIANSALRASLAIYHLISNAHSWNNC